MTHRAIVEIKPTLAHFNDYISRRMRGVAPHYYTEMLLLYSEKENTWYRIDMITGTLSVFGIPIPGETPIHKLYKPLTLPAQPIYSHRYNKRLEPIKSTLKGATNVVEAVITGPKKPQRKRYRRSYQQKVLIDRILQAIPDIIEVILIAPFKPRRTSRKRVRKKTSRKRVRKNGKNNRLF